MNWKADDFRRVTTGVSHITEHDGAICFHRFTEEQTALYVAKRTEGMVTKTRASSGVSMYFKTDSRYLYLKAELSPGSSRKFFSFDLLINGAFADSLNNFDNLEIPPIYSSMPAPLGVAEKTFDLGENIPHPMRTLFSCLYFFHSCRVHFFLSLNKTI